MIKLDEITDKYSFSYCDKEEFYDIIKDIKKKDLKDISELWYVLHFLVFIISKTNLIV